MDFLGRRLCVWFVVAVFLSSMDAWIGKSGLVYADCFPRQGCDLALVSYKIAPGDTLSNLSKLFQIKVKKLEEVNGFTNPDVIAADIYIYIPIPCTCNKNQLGYDLKYQLDFVYTELDDIVVKFHNLSKREWMVAATPINDPKTLFAGFVITVPINCSCGNPDSNEYGPFVTYVTEKNDNLQGIEKQFSVSGEVIQSLNPTVEWTNLKLHETVFFPVNKDYHGSYFPPYSSQDENNRGHKKMVIIGVSVGGGLVVVLVAMVTFFFFRIYLPKRKQDAVAIRRTSGPLSGAHADSIESTAKGMSKESTGGSPNSVLSGGSFPSVLSDFTVEKSVEFSYNELASATDNFSLDHKIGEGGYGSVYYGVLHDQKVAIKKMNLQGTKEFLAELKILTRVHHTNLVQLIGFCTVDSLFLIYEFVERGTLSQHLHGSGFPPLSWPVRVQIVLDAARGLEYIHENTKPTYIHRDVKTSNILIDKQYHAKVADFGLTKLTESGVGSISLTFPTKLVGTFGYMPPEYARFGDVSPKVDVYSFGVVLFEIISAKEAIVRSTSMSSFLSHGSEPVGLVTLFDKILKEPDGKENLHRLVDPALGNDYPVEAVWKMAQLAGACTEENPELRPSMRTVVVALMTLFSSQYEGTSSPRTESQV